MFGMKKQTAPSARQELERKLDTLLADASRDLSFGAIAEVLESRASGFKANADMNWVHPAAVVNCHTPQVGTFEQLRDRLRRHA
jgi:hypothetical protein